MNRQYVFQVDQRPDGGEFAAGDHASLKWDILRRAGSHELPDKIDLSSTKHLKPYSIACLGAMAELARETSKKVHIDPPVDQDCFDHLTRLGLPGFFDHEWSNQSQRETNLPLRRVNWPPGDEGEQIVELLAPRAQLPAGVFPTMAGHLDEVIRNALSHAQSKIDCIVVGQAFDQAGTVEIAIVDLGIGIRRHLTQNPNYSTLRTDEEAIFKAVQEGITGTPPGQCNPRGEPNSGAGLSELREFCEDGGGELTVLSGRAWVTFSSDRSRVTGRLHSAFNGCLVNIRFFASNYLPRAAEKAII